MYPFSPPSPQFSCTRGRPGDRVGICLYRTLRICILEHALPSNHCPPLSARRGFPAMTAVQWFVARNGQKVGPFTPGELKQLADAGLLQPSEMIWTEGMSRWVEASQFAVLFPRAGQKRYWLSVGGLSRGPFLVDQVRAAQAGRQV